jgi:hypothetical protein
VANLILSEVFSAAMVNGSPSPIIHGNDVQVLCSAVMDLISRVQRPYLWRVKVTGQPPHAVVRTYDIAGNDQNAVADIAIKRFCREMAHPLSIFGAMQ